MTDGTMLICLLALVAIGLGAVMVFRQALVRRWWAALRGTPPSVGPPRNGAEDPAHYALIIFGMMLLAFGLIILGFFASYAMLT